MTFLLLCVLLGWTPTARAQPAALIEKHEPPELINLLEADLTSRGDLRRIAAGLEATFQLFTRRPPKPGTAPQGAHPPEEEGGQALRAECSGSFLGPTVAVTADHCIMRDREHLAERLVLRRHRFRVEGGRLVRDGYEDYALSGRVLGSYNDLALLELSKLTPAPAGATFSAPNARFAYAPGTVFHALGYPNDSYAAPYAAANCHIEAPGHPILTSPARQYQGDCRVNGGMSGGPQFLDRGGVQIGVNSATQDRPGGVVSASPRLVFIDIPPAD